MQRSKIKRNNVEFHSRAQVCTRAEVNFAAKAQERWHFHKCR
jgi:hypothetical protein